MNRHPHRTQQKQHQSFPELQDASYSYMASFLAKQNLQMPSINTYQQHLSSQHIEQLVDIEMKRLEANCKCEEENYVKQMLLENPIIVERRTTPSKVEQSPTTSCSSFSSATTRDNCNNTITTSTASLSHKSMEKVSIKDEELLLQQQDRSESCRRSRINNKIKKAKMKYRHKFMSNKLCQSVHILDCLQNMIEQMEQQLINQGLSALHLLKLRNIFYNDVIADQ